MEHEPLNPASWPSAPPAAPPTTPTEPVAPAPSSFSPPGEPPPPPGTFAPPPGTFAPPPGTFAPQWQPPGNYGFPPVVSPYQLPPEPTFLSAEWMGLDPQHPPRWGGWDVPLGLACWLGVQIFVGMVLTLVGLPTLWVTVGAMAAGQVEMVGYVAYAARRKGSGSIGRDFGFRFRWFDPLLGLGLGFVILIVSGIVRIAIAEAFSDTPGSNASTIFGDVQGHTVALLCMSVLAAIGAPIVEELFFRGLALRAFEKRWGAIVGIIGSSLVFAVLHWQPGSLGSTLSLLGGILTFGLAFALMARLFKRLGPSIFSHMTINGLATSLLLYETFSGNSVLGN